MYFASALKQSLVLPYCFALIGVLVCAYDVYGQKTIQTSYISVAEGVASPTVRCIFQDSYGLIWLATANGLQKYDGYSFQTYKHRDGVPTSLASSDVYGVTEDPAHNLWISHGDGVSVLDRTRDDFKNFHFTRDFNFPTGDHEPALKTFRDSQGRMWAGTRNIELVVLEEASDKWKMARYDVVGVDSLSPHSGITLGITEDSHGGIWSSSSTFGLMHLPKGATRFKQVDLQRLNGLDVLGELNMITGLYADTNNIIWITSRHGVYKYNPENGEIKVIRQYPEAGFANESYFNHIATDPSGNVWITNNARGILKFNLNSDSYEEISIAGRSKVPGKGWNVALINLMIDRSGIFWFGSLENGMLKYDPVNKPFSLLEHNEADPKSLSMNAIFGVASSKLQHGVVFVGTRGGGLNIYNPVKASFERIAFKADDDRYGGSVRAVAEGPDGALWLGTWGDGLIKLDQAHKEIARYKYDSTSETSISGNLVRVIKPDSQGRLWIGTDSGLNLFDPASGTFKRISSKDTKHYPRPLLKEVEGLFASNAAVGLIDKVNSLQNKTLEIELKEPGKYLVAVVGEADYSNPADFGWIENERKDTIWSFPAFENSFHAGGAWKNRIAIDSIKLEQGKYVLRYKTDDSHAFDGWNEQPPDQINMYGIALLKIADNNQLAIIEKAFVRDKDELIVAGSNISDIEVTDKYVWTSATGSGLSRIDIREKTVETFTHNAADKRSLSSNIIHDIYIDSQGVIWLATAQGLNVYDESSKTFTRYNDEDGLPTNITTGILEGDNGEMWIATQNGISQMVPNQKLGKVTFINYNSVDGLGGDIFLSLTSAKGSDGSFYFGGEHGLTTFRSITANKTPPAVVFSNLFVSNKSVLAPEGQALLPGGLMNADKIVLPYDRDNISFEFAALHYANPRKNQYAHMLKGYDKDWIYDNRNFATYTNLDPGEYDFMVRASNAYGIWNEAGKSIHISILPPWWKTWWAYAGYVLIFGFAIFAGDRGIRRSIKLRERERSREKELKQAREIEKAYAHLKETQAQLLQSEKMASLGELTAGIAHEIQNPLNFVNNFAEINRELVDEMNECIALGKFADVAAIARNISENEAKINFHGKRADAIVKGMLQHSRSSSGVKEPTDINQIAEEYLRLAYHGLRAKDKTFNAVMKTAFDTNVGKVNAVPQDIGRVVLNLITNAFYVVTEKKVQLNGQFVEGARYEPTVTVSTSKLPGRVEIRVSDNGSGIPKNVMDKIFQPFFTTKPSGQGTGLGLSMSYEIITKGHGGDLKVETQIGYGTTFIIVLPN